MTKKKKSKTASARRVVFSISSPPELLRRIDAYADQIGEPRSKAIRQAIEEYLDEREATAKFMGDPVVMGAFVQALGQPGVLGSMAKALREDLDEDKVQQVLGFFDASGASQPPHAPAGKRKKGRPG